MTQNWTAIIENETQNNPVVLFIRGTADAPRCGFSYRVVKMFRDLNIPFASHDMDADPALWQTLKELNNWPTSPQIYVKGEFIGGCDIVTEMAKNGDLQKLLGLERIQENKQPQSQSLS